MKKIIYWTLPISMLIVQFLISSIFTIAIHQDFDAIYGVMAICIVFPFPFLQPILLLLTGYCYISIMAAINDSRDKWLTTMVMWIVWVAVWVYFFFILTAPATAESGLGWSLHSFIVIIAYLLPLTIAMIKLGDNI